MICILKINARFYDSLIMKKLFFGTRPAVSFIFIDIVNRIELANNIFCPVVNKIIHLAQNIDELNYSLKSTIYSFGSFNI